MMRVRTLTIVEDFSCFLPSSLRNESNKHDLTVNISLYEELARTFSIFSATKVFAFSAMTPAASAAYV